MGRKNMPLYDYRCQTHGVFHELATMQQSADPMPCPECGVLAARIIMLPPELFVMPSDKKKAMARNERAAHEPLMSSVESREAKRLDVEDRRRSLHKHHGKSCGCSHHEVLPAHTATQVSSLRQQVVYLADGSKVFPSQRPWMISH
jgi:putative FmdB family regulatory protein